MVFLVSFLLDSLILVCLLKTIETFIHDIPLFMHITFICIGGVENDIFSALLAWEVESAI